MNKQKDFFQENENSLYLPMHSDNWAYFLSTGYIGGAYFENLSSDFQNNTGHLLAGFKSFPPLWSINMGDLGIKVVVEIDTNEITILQDEDFYICNDFIQLNKAKHVYFNSDDEFNNFHASYNLFNDVPNKIITSSVKLFPQEDVAYNEEFFKRQKINKFEELRTQKDLFCGWTVELLDCLENGSEEIILQHLLKPSVISQPNKPVNNLILSLLQAAQGNNNHLDEFIWEVTISSILEKKSVRGFDSQELINEIEGKLLDKNNFKKDIETWLTLCRKIISAEQDLGAYKDEKGKLGRITALYAIMAYKVEDVNNLITNKSLGPKVSTLLRLVAGAFDGISRSEHQRKSDISQFKMLLDLSERIQNNLKTEITLDKVNISKSLDYQKQNYKFNDDVIFQKKITLPSYIQQLKYCAQKFNINLYKEDDSNLIYLLHNGTKIFCDAIKIQNKEIINFYTPALNNKFLKNNNYLIDVLKLASQIGTPVGVRTILNEDTVCSFIHLLTDTLDQDEFEYTIQQLSKFPSEIDNLINNNKYSSPKKTNNKKQISKNDD